MSHNEYQNQMDYDSQTKKEEEEEVCCVGCGDRVCGFHEEPDHKNDRDEALCNDCHFEPQEGGEEEEEDERYCDNDDCPYGGYIYDEELEKYKGKEYICMGCKTGKGLQERELEDKKVNGCWEEEEEDLCPCCGTDCDDCQLPWCNCPEEEEEEEEAYYCYKCNIVLDETNTWVMDTVGYRCFVCKEKQVDSNSKIEKTILKHLSSMINDYAKKQGCPF